jgi:hypothetical protein
VLLAVLALLWPELALAEAPLSVAQTLFEEGRAALRAADYTTACRKLAESQRLDPASGTQLNLAVCHELQNKTATAWAHYQVALRLARKEAARERQDIAAERLRALAPRISYLTIDASPETRTESLALFIDGVPVGPPGRPLAVDPGRHLLEARAPGKHHFRTEFTVGEAEDKRILVPRLAQDSAVGVDRAASRPPVPHRTVRSLGIAACTIATLAAGAGTYFGLRARSEWAARNDHCPSGQCDAIAVAAGQSAKRFALLAEGAFAFSLIMGGPGIYLLLLPEPGQPRAGTSASVHFGLGGTL